MRIGSAKELKVYQMAYALAMEIFRLRELARGVGKKAVRSALRE
jgi:hypothetical protein